VPKVYVNVLVGESAADATSVLATADPDVVQAVVDALMAKLQSSERQILLERHSTIEREFEA
jgi:hypothetical protein